MPTARRNSSASGAAAATAVLEPVDTDEDADTGTAVTPDSLKQTGVTPTGPRQQPRTNTTRSKRKKRLTSTPCSTPGSGPSRTGRSRA